MRKLILKHGLDLGDVMMMTIAVRDLHMAYPRQFQTDVRTRFPHIWSNNPYITSIPDGEGEEINVGYPLIQNPGNLAFSDGFRLDLADKLKVDIPFTSSKPDLHLTDKEKQENIVKKNFQYLGKYWILNAGYKKDAILKYYPFWQEVVDLLKNKIQIVQIGTTNDEHPLLEGVFNLVGKTNVRDLIKVIYHSEGTIGPISCQFVIAAVFGKPSVIVAGAKEPPRWQMYNFQRYLNTNGCMSCTSPDGNGCWTSKYQDCRNRVGNVPRCFAMISPDEVARNVLLYYEGGALSY